MKEQGELFGLILKPYPFRLRAGDIIRFDGRLGRILRVSDCAAVVLMNRKMRQFKTRFDKPVRFQPSPVTFRISANAQIEILNRKKLKKRRKEHYA